MQKATKTMDMTREQSVESQEDEKVAHSVYADLTSRTPRSKESDIVFSASNETTGRDCCSLKKVWKVDRKGEAAHYKESLTEWTTACFRGTERTSGLHQLSWRLVFTSYGTAGAASGVGSA